MKSLVVTSLVAGFIAALALVPAAPASAVAPPTTRPDRVAGAQWGWSQSLAVAPETLVESNGGWSRRSVTSSCNPPVVTTPCYMAQFYISEPGSVSGSVGFYVQGLGIRDARDYGVRQGAGIRIGAGGSPSSGGFGFLGEVRCGYTEWSKPSEQFVDTRAWGGGFSLPVPATSEGFPFNTGTYFSTGVSRASCPFLVSVKAFIVQYKAGGKTLTYPIEWSAERWFSGTGYADANYEQELCLHVDSKATGCKDFGDVDPSDYCLGAPVMRWLDFSWVPATIKHYSDCLFYPYGGWDSDDWLGDALENSPLNVFSAGIAGLTNGWSSVTGGCGVITAGSGNWAAFRFDTCDWGAFAPQLKTVVTLTIGIMSAIWVISFIISSTTGIFNKYTPNPLTHDPAPRGVHFE